MENKSNIYVNVMERVITLYNKYILERKMSRILKENLNVRKQSLRTT